MTQDGAGPRFGLTSVRSERPGGDNAGRGVQVGELGVMGEEEAPGVGVPR